MARILGYGMATQKLIDEASTSGRWSKDMVKAWSEQVEMIALAADLIAATKVRCGCGNHGDWSAGVSGTSGAHKVRWAGCANCRVQALGSPVCLTAWRRWCRLTEKQQAAYVAHAVCGGTPHKYAEVDTNTLESTFDAETVG